MAGAFLRLVSFQHLMVLFFLLGGTTLNAQLDNRKTQPIRILTAGFASSDGYEEKFIVAEEWGIEFYPVAGCLVSEQLMDSINHYNDSVFQLVEQKFGKDWQNTLENEITALRKRNEKLKLLISFQDGVQKLAQECNVTDCHLEYTIQPTRKPEKFIVSLIKYRVMGDVSEEVSHLTFRVNNKTNKVKRLT